jgi:hypothetical protein
MNNKFTIMKNIQIKIYLGWYSPVLRRVISGMKIFLSIASRADLTDIPVGRMVLMGVWLYSCPR